MPEQAESLSRAIAERVVKTILGFTDSKEDQDMWKWQLRTVEVNRLINRIQGILDGYEIKLKESSNAQNDG
jgi:hypothetical protein